MAAPVAAANDASPRPLKRPRLSLDKPDGSLDTGADFLSFDFSPEPEEPTRGKRSTETRLPAVRDGNRPAKNRGRAAGTDGANKRKAIDLDLEDEQEARQGSHPWAHYVRWQDHKDATEMLNAEVGAFYDYMTPTAHEHQLRAEIIAEVASVITKRYPDAEVRPFGSFATQSYLPFGDIDLVVSSPAMTTRPTKKTLFEIAAMLKTRRIAQDVIVIHRAKVPIVKFVTTRGLIRMDISLNQTNGINAVSLVNQLLSSTSDRAARAMIAFVKAYLSSRDLNEVYSGGISSFSIICLVVSFLQLHPRVRSGQIDPNENVGVLLVEFFELYGKCFNYDIVGISVVNGGSYFGKDEKGWQNGRNTLCMSIEDPGDPTNDISQGAYNTFAIRQAFSAACDLLTTALQNRAYYLPYPDHWSQSPSLLGNVYAMSEDDIRKRKRNAQEAAAAASRTSNGNIDRAAYGPAATMTFRGPLAVVPPPPKTRPPPPPPAQAGPSKRKAEEVPEEAWSAHADALAAEVTSTKPKSPNRKARREQRRLAEATAAAAAKKRKTELIDVDVEEASDMEESVDEGEIHIHTSNVAPTPVAPPVVVAKPKKKKKKVRPRPVETLMTLPADQLTKKEKKQVRAVKQMNEATRLAERSTTTGATTEARAQVAEAHGLPQDRDLSSSPAPDYQPQRTHGLLGASDSEDDSRYNVTSASKKSAAANGKTNGFKVASLSESSSEGTKALSKRELAAAKSKASKTRAFWQAKGPRLNASVASSGDEDGEVIELSD